MTGWVPQIGYLVAHNPHPLQAEIYPQRKFNCCVRARFRQDRVQQRWVLKGTIVVLNRTHHFLKMCANAKLKKLRHKSMRLQSEIHQQVGHYPIAKSNPVEHVRLVYFEVIGF